MKDEKVYADAADLELQIDMLEGFDANSDDKYNTQMICWLKELQRRRAIQSGNSAQPVTVPDGWIPVSERMPEFNDEVLAWHRHGYSLIAVYSTSKDPITYKTYRCLVDNKGHEIDATHWQPLPDAPKGV